MAERSVLVRIRGNSNDLVRATAAARRAIGDLRKEIDTTNDRTAWMAQSFLALGPTLAPLGATAAPLLAGLATQMTAAGLAAGSTALAFVGLGDSMKAVNEYQLEPTAENFAKMRTELDEFGVAGEQFVWFLQQVGPEFDRLQIAAREGMFPGMAQGISEFMEVLPQAERVIGNVSEAIGSLSAEAGESLAGPKFEEFFSYLENEAAGTLLDMGRAAGNVADGFAAILTAFGPLTADFSNGMLGMTRSFADWAHELDDSQGFADFVAYIEKSTPKVLDFLDSFADAFLQIVEAAAPVGDVLLPILSSFLDVVGALANTPLGPTFIAVGAAMSAYGRAAALAKITTGGLAGSLLGLERSANKTNTAFQKMTAIKRGAGLAVGTLGALALTATDVDEKMGLSNTAMLGMMGLVAGPWGAAVGAGVGLMMDLAGSTQSTEERTSGLTDTLNEQTGAITRRTREWAASKIVDAGVSDDMRAIGLTASELTDVLLGTGDAARIYADAVAIRTDPNSTADEKNAAAQVVNFLEDQGIATQEVIDKEKERKRVTIEAMHGISQAQFKARADAGRLVAKYYDLASATEAFTGAIERSNRVLDTRGSLRDYEASLDDFAEALGKVENKTRLFNEDGTFNIDLPKARELEGLLDGIGREALEVADNLKGTARVQALRQARADFIDAAEKAGLGRDAIRRLVEQIFKMPIRRATEIVVRTQAAKGNVDALQKQLDTIDRDYYVKIHARVPNLSGMGPQITSADGSTVPGPRYPYGDKVHALVAPGEEIISNRHGQADRHRALLKAINENRYANGGTIAVHASTPAAFPAQAGPAIDYDRLAMAMAQVRPLYGDVQISGDPASFKRQMLADKQAAGLGG